MDEGMAAERERDLDRFLTFIDAIVAIARLWFVQHQSVRHVLRYHSRVAHLLMIWVLTIVFLPFPTALVAASGDSDLTKLLYIGSIVVSAAVLALVEAFLVRHPELTDGDDDSDPVDGVANVVLLLAALGISVAVPATSYFPLLLLVVARPVAEGWRRLRGRGSRGARVGE